MHVAWTFKHKPKSAAGIVGNREALHLLREWLESWSEGIPSQKAAFLHGPPGVGKTVSVEALSSDLGMELVEKNASDYRTQEKIKSFAGLASQYSSFSGKKRIILLDEMDGVYGTVDRGGIPAITQIIRETRCPIVLIANDYWNKRFVSFRDKKKYLIVEFKKPPLRSVVKFLQGICAKECIIADEEAVKFIAQRNQGDVRSAINDLQAFTEGKKSLTFDDVEWIAHRDRKDVIFTVLRLVLYAKSCSAAKQSVDMADTDLDMLFEWIYENTPHHFNVPGELSNAMEALARADLYRARIRRTRNWKLTRYFVDLMTAGVAMARNQSKPSGWIPFRFPQRMRMLSTGRGERVMKGNIGRKIGRRMHLSISLAEKDVLPYLKVIFENNPAMSAGLSRWFDFKQEEINYLAGSKRQAKLILRSAN
ncbi:MAG: replication factor C large subunit [Candidatus Bathyarchaeota archaeon]|nr:replication factor C large subunit [Candidatus Bathyarchaeota archaeon]